MIQNEVVSNRRFIPPNGQRTGTFLLWKLVVPITSAGKVLVFPDTSGRGLSMPIIRRLNLKDMRSMHATLCLYYHRKLLIKHQKDFVVVSTNPIYKAAGQKEFTGGCTVSVHHKKSKPLYYSSTIERATGVFEVVCTTPCIHSFFDYEKGMTMTIIVRQPR